MKVILLFCISLASALVGVSLTRDTLSYHVANIHERNGAFDLEKLPHLEVSPGRYCVSLSDADKVMNECALYSDMESNPGLEIVVYTKDGEAYSIGARRGTSGISLKTIEIPKEELQEKGESEIAKEKEEKNEKSFIQRNWMYIVPPLAIMFFMLPNDEPEK